MTPRLRVIDTGLAGARRNVALTAALLAAHARGEGPDTLRYHRYPTCVLIGRSQEARTALDPAACRRRQAAIARRITGGGAVAMAPGILAWDLVTARRRLRRAEPPHPGEPHRRGGPRRDGRASRPAAAAPGEPARPSRRGTGSESLASFNASLPEGRVA